MYHGPLDSTHRHVSGLERYCVGSTTSLCGEGMSIGALVDVVGPAAALRVHAPGCMLVYVCSFSESAPCACNDACWELGDCG